MKIKLSKLLSFRTTFYGVRNPLEISRFARNDTFHRGQALITLLFYVLIVVTISSAAVVLIIISSRSATTLQEGEIAYYIAESGAENAFLRVLRDPTYTGETNLPVGDGTATIVVTHGNPTTITSTGVSGNFIRKVQVIASYVNGYYTVTSWNEIE